MKKKKGSLTVFAALSLMLVAAVIFTLLEGARNIEIRRVTWLEADSAVESLFASYDRTLWQSYHLLGVYGTDEEGVFSAEKLEDAVAEYAERAMNPDLFEEKGSAMLCLRPTEIELLRYGLLTDQKGEAFEAAASAYMKEKVLYDVVEETYNRCRASEAMDKSYRESEEVILDAQDTLKKAKEEAESEDGASASDSHEEPDVILDNPMDHTDQLKKTGVLALVLRPDATVSANAIPDTKVLLSNRECFTGNNPEEYKNTLYDRVLMDKYLSETFRTYRNPHADGVLQYELEYVLCGKDNDVDNLKATLNKLIAARESANLAYLISDPDKVNKATELAAALAGATASPLVIATVQIGILGAWAYAESILDVRALLEGKKIALLKNAEQWSTDLDAIGNIGSEFLVAKECSNGLVYEQYLEMLLAIQSTEEIAFRSMDLIEQDLQDLPGCDMFRMDHMVVSAEFCLCGEWDSIFLSLASLEAVHDQVFQIQCNSNYSYYK